MVRALESLEEYQQVIDDGRPIVIDFWAVWSGPSRIITPMFENLIATRAVPGIEGFKVDVDRQEEIAQAVGVRTTPTFVAFKGGEKIGEVIGANPLALQELMRKVRDHDA
ncbi:thioredoxin-like protein [Schizophyllum commune]